MADLDASRLGFQPEEEMRPVNKQRHEEINDLYREYEAGWHLTLTAMPETGLQLIPAWDLRIEASNPEFESCDDIGDMRISRRSDPSAVNFMGYAREKKCLAFKGETRFLDQFLDFTNEVFESHNVEIAFKAPCDVRVPPGGLAPGISYQEFAGRVEIVEYAMWLKGSCDDQEDNQEPQINVIPVQGYFVRDIDSQDETNSEHPPDDERDDKSPCGGSDTSSSLSILSITSSPEHLAIDKQQLMNLLLGPPFSPADHPSPSVGSAASPEYVPDSGSASLYSGHEMVRQYSLRARSESVEVAETTDMESNTVKDGGLH